ncbi:MIP family channel protein [Cellulomonas sp. Root485]|uniref:MIP family channel protein n=1 Tax=Cellulomonas sp. Root485 TaxID=1736546 RepID=UPI0006FD62E5|nr:MIP family channel protein [Cellulomonas sp. Root485]KQY24421.1 MIP family channel protein [Cellulomonas sp. Root485]
MSQDNPDKAAGSPEPDETTVAGTPAPEEATAAAAADTPAPAAEPVVEPAAEPEADEDVVVEELDAYVVPAGTVVVTGPSLVARLGAEAFGTFTLVLVGLGIALYSTVSGLGGTLGVALGFGIAVLAGIIAVGHVSGGHFNPAVTLGAAIGGRTAWKDVLPYWLAQLVGGILAAAILFITIPATLPGLLNQGAEASSKSFFSSVSNGYAEHSPLSVASQGQVEFSLVIALLVEIVVTAVFVGIILGATDRRSANVQAPFAIGLALAVLILVAIPVTNASLNPARSTASAIFSDSWALSQLWLFWVAPLVGAALAGLIYRAFAAEPAEDNLLEEDDAYVTTDDVLVVTER